MDADVTRESAIVLVQVLPMMLVVGLVGPLIFRFRIPAPERWYFASQTTLIVVYEGLLVSAIASNNQRLISGLVSAFAIPVLAVTFGALTPVWI